MSAVAGDGRVRPPIVILGTGRSGSSLLQRLLNTHDRVAIWGEHHGFLAPLAEAYDKLMSGPRIADRSFDGGAGQMLAKLRRPDASPAWVNPFAKPEVRTAFTNLLLGMYGASDALTDLHWGFKEIRYRVGVAVLAFLDDLFPGFRLLFPARNPRDTVSSMMVLWPRHPSADALGGADSNEDSAVMARCDRRLRHWTEVGAYILEFQAVAPDRVCVVRYEDLCREPGPETARIFDFLRLDPPPADRLEQVLRTPVGAAPRTPERIVMDGVVQSRIEKNRAALLPVARALGYDV